MCICMCVCLFVCVRVCLRVFDLLSVDTRVIGSVMISLPSVNISGRFRPLCSYTRHASHNDYFRFGSNLSAV